MTPCCSFVWWSLSSKPLASWALWSLRVLLVPVWAVARLPTTVQRRACLVGSSDIGRRYCMYVSMNGFLSLSSPTLLNELYKWRKLMDGWMDSLWPLALERVVLSLLYNVCVCVSFLWSYLSCSLRFATLSACWPYITQSHVRTKKTCTCKVFWQWWVRPGYRKHMGL